MSKERMIAAALEDLYDSEDDGAEHPATLRRRISLAIQECWHDGVRLQELVDAVRRKMRDGAALARPGSLACAMDRICCCISSGTGACEDTPMTLKGVPAFAMIAIVGLRCDVDECCVGRNLDRHRGSSEQVFRVHYGRRSHSVG